MLLNFREDMLREHRRELERSLHRSLQLRQAQEVRADAPVESRRRPTLAMLWGRAVCAGAAPRR